jgi:transcriptional regulator with XRE-family HTH domain
MLTTGNQLKAARILAEIEQKELAEKAGVNVNTIRNMESAGGGAIAGRAANVQIVQRILEGMGVEFLNHGRPGVRLTTASRKSIDTDEAEVIQYPEFKDGDGGPGSGG